MKNLKKIFLVVLLVQQTMQAQSPQFVGFMTGYPFSDLERTKISMTRAVNAGASLVAFDLEVKALSMNYNDFLLGTVNWTQFDNLINHINSLSGCNKVAVRIVIGYSNVGGQIPYLEMGGQVPLIGSSDVMRDQWGNPCMSNWNIVSSPSFAKASTTNRIKNVVHIITQRLHSILGSKLYWISTTTSGAYESEFSLSNNASHTDAAGYWINDGGDYACRFDYHPDNIAQFYPWLQSKYCSDISALNTAYGTSYTSFTSVPVPMVPATTINTSSETQIRTMFSTVQGRDWYYFNSEQQVNFWSQLKSEIKSISSSIKFCVENGGTADNLSILRGNFNTPEINTIAEVVKPGQSGRDWFDNRLIGGDISATNFTIKRQVEVSEYDVVNQAGITDPVAAKNIMRTHAIYNYKLGNECVIFIGDTATNFFVNTLALISEINSVLNTTGYGSVNVVGSYTASVNDLISNYSSLVSTYNTIKPSSFNDILHYYLTPPTWCSSGTACSGSVNWGTPGNSTCGGITTFSINTIGSPTEFSSDGSTWHPANFGTTNTYTYSVPSTTACVSFWIRPAGCSDVSKVVWGCYTGGGYPCLMSTEINDFNDLSSNISVFPNPAKSELNVLGIFKEEVKEVIVKDVLGRELIKQNNSLSINIDGLSAGNYFMQIVTKENLSKTLKFIKE